jgi:carbamoyl-phosphate synthase large subunit
MNESLAIVNARNSVHNMTDKRLTLLLTSVGSFVGKNILDSLDGRRENVNVIGCNSIADVANNFRCDEVYLVPPVLEADDYRHRLLEIIERTKPDLILPGRDDDVSLLAKLAEQHPALAVKIPLGCVDVARIFDDKKSSWQFAKEMDIPFVDTVRADRHELTALLRKYGFPLLAKPFGGNGSKGVLLLFTESQLWSAAERKGLVFQPYINPSPELINSADSFSDGIPLFYAPLITGQIALQAIISPDGKVQSILCTNNAMQAGRNEQIIRMENPTLAELARTIAVKFSKAGWRGCLNIQGRINKADEFIAFEFNGRMTGSTSARLLLGFDELGLLVQHFVGDNLLPSSPYHGTADREVQEILACYIANSTDKLILHNTQYWQSATTYSDKS